MGGLLMGLVGAASGCAHRYAAAPALAYRDIPYTAVDGTAWPEKRLRITELQERHQMHAPFDVHYVELNPSGARTLVFVHGLGSYLKFWRYQLDHFAEAGYRVLALDMVGFWKSDKPASFPYTMEAMAEVVRIFAHRTKAQRPVLVGHSMGGQTALSYAIRYPEALAGLVLVAPAGFEMFGRGERLWFKSVFGVNFIKSGREEDVRASIRVNNFNRWRSGYEWLVEERIRTAKNDDFDAYAYANVRSVQGLLDNDFVRENLRHVGAPTLITHGDVDRLIPNRFLHGGTTRSLMERAQAQIPGARLETLGGCGHTLQIDCAEALNETIGTFLESLPAPPSSGADASRAPAGRGDGKEGRRPVPELLGSKHE
ncbi:MAG: alpha/beta hydrolase [Myxococcota bacterium]